MKTLIFITVGILLILTIGATQNYLNNPVRGCKKFDASLQFNGYYCKDGHKFQFKR